MDKLLLIIKKNKEKDIVETLKESNLSMSTLNITLIPLFPLSEDLAQGVNYKSHTGRVSPRLVSF